MSRVCVCANYARKLSTDYYIRNSNRQCGFYTFSGKMLRRKRRRKRERENGWRLSKAEKSLIMFSFYSCSVQNFVLERVQRSGMTFYQVYMYTLCMCECASVEVYKNCYFMKKTISLFLPPLSPACHPWSLSYMYTIWQWTVDDEMNKSVHSIRYTYICIYRDMSFGNFMWFHVKLKTFWKRCLLCLPRYCVSVYRDITFRLVRYTTENCANKECI